MAFPLQPRVFLTGAGSGLGRELAVQMARKYKARLLLADINKDTAIATAAMVQELGGTAEVIVCDVTRVQNLEAAARRIQELWGGIDILVNNAGVSAAGTVGEFSLEDWQWCLQINLWGVIHGCHVFAPMLREQGQGWVLNVASNAAIASLAEMGPYNVSKAGVVSLSETMRSELGAHGVSVSVLCPTFFPTNLMDSFRSSHARQRKMAQAMFRDASVTTEFVAAKALQGLQKGRLMIVPQRDGRAIWLAKRLAPDLLYNFMTREYRRRVLQHPSMPKE